MVVQTGCFLSWCHDFFLLLSSGKLNFRLWSWFKSFQSGTVLFFESCEVLFLIIRTSFEFLEPSANSNCLKWRLVPGQCCSGIDVISTAFKRQCLYFQYFIVRSNEWLSDHSIIFHDSIVMFTLHGVASVGKLQHNLVFPSEPPGTDKKRKSWKIYMTIPTIRNQKCYGQVLAFQKPKLNDR